MQLKQRGQVWATVHYQKLTKLFFDIMLIFVAIMLNFLNFWRTCKQLPKKLQKRNNILKKIAGSDWGCSNGTLLLTYKAIFRSTLNYGAPVCHLGFHNQHYKGTTCKNKHCTSQITGCVQLSDTNDWHNENGMLSVQVHTEILAEQFPAAVIRATVLITKQPTQPVSVPWDRH